MIRGDWGIYQRPSSRTWVHQRLARFGRHSEQIARVLGPSGDAEFVSGDRSDRRFALWGRFAVQLERCGLAAS